MRSADRATPTIDGHRPPVEPWPAVLHIGVERQPVVNYVYDDYTASYDSPSHAFTYDDRQAWPFDRQDLWCQFHGLTITAGMTGPDGPVESTHVQLSLDNRDGALSQYDAAGRLVDWGPGSALDVWAVLDGADWWLFSGEVSAWRELADGTVEVEAFDAFSQLNQQGPQWNPGNYDDTVGQRLDKILATVAYAGPTRWDTGTVHLHSYLTNASPLEEMHAVTASDGGLLLIDADGTLVYRNRTWPAGRIDQVSIPALSDNYCAVPFVVWDAELTTDDDVIVNRATLTNVARETVTSTNQASIDRYGPQTLERTNDQWIGVAAGQALADYVVTRRGDGYLRLDGFVLHLNDRRQDLWALGIDRRIGDQLTWYHEQPTTTGVNLVVLTLVVAAITHEITPESWVVSLRTSRAVGNVVALRYDRTPFNYDDADPRVIYVL